LSRILDTHYPKAEGADLRDKRLAISMQSNL